MTGASLARVAGVLDRIYDVGDDAPCQTLPPLVGRLDVRWRRHEQRHGLAERHLQRAYRVGVERVRHGEHDRIGFERKRQDTRFAQELRADAFVENRHFREVGRSGKRQPQYPADPLGDVTLACEAQVG
jgi:hypothetical protein